MELSVFNIVRKPVITSKSVILFRKLGQVVFEVDPRANKVMIAQAVEKIWNVKVKKVRTESLAGKNKSFAKRKFRSSDKKKAFITLQKGYKIEIPGMSELLAKEKMGGAHSKTSDTIEKE